MSSKKKLQEASYRFMIEHNNLYNKYARQCHLISRRIKTCSDEKNN